MYTKFIAICMVATNARSIKIKQRADQSSIKRLSSDCSQQVMGFLAPNILQTLSHVDKSTYKQELAAASTFAPALQILGLQDNIEQFLKDFPQRRRCTVPIPNQMS